mmetsp:Transcript_28891/g.61004  ORF Transcript_28891/g.61004 Transcript_28891/m.61004 type:complete len:285 (+) Transcript_28891:27-881(+)
MGAMSAIAVANIPGLATDAVPNLASRLLSPTDVPRINTPAPGDWPQSNVTGCGFTGLPFASVLSECTEPLDPSAPDLRGYWKDDSGNIKESIEMCGSRWLDISAPVIHDFPTCTGVVGDGFGCMDYSGPDIVGKDGLCTPIVVACKFEIDDEGNNCVNLYVQNPASPDKSNPVKIVSRCLQNDGSMVWVHPLAGTHVYTKVPVEDEPNCMKCVGGENDGTVAYTSDEILPCPYEERQWMKCEDDPSESNEDSTPTNQPTKNTAETALAYSAQMLITVTIIAALC